MFSNMFQLSLVLCFGCFVLRYVYFILFVHDYYASCVKGTLCLYIKLDIFSSCYCCVVNMSTKQSTLYHRMELCIPQIFILCSTRVTFSVNNVKILWLFVVFDVEMYIHTFSWYTKLIICIFITQVINPSYDFLSFVSFSV